MENKKRHIWQAPWGYIEAFIIVAVLFVESLAFEFITQKPAPIISFPTNVYLLSGIVLLCFILHFISKKHSSVAWFSSIPVSIAAITYFLLLSLIMAVVPQKTNSSELFFLFNVTSSWTYYFATAYLLVVLGMVSIRRLLPISKNNIGFFLNHAGLWITIAAATFGAGDIQKYSMSISEGKTEWLAYPKNMHPIQLDFALQLQEFSIEEYPAKLAVVNKNSGVIVTKNRKKAIFEADTVKGITWDKYHIRIQKYLPLSMFFMDDYFPLSDIGATQSYYITVQNYSTNKSIKGWVGASSISQQATFLTISDSLAIVALQPEAKKFSSKVRVYEKSGAVYDTVIEVNKPISIQDYKVYQTGYDEKMGKWSTTSILEIVSDPWLQYVYIGIFLMIAGSLYIIWFGKKSNTK